MAGIENLSGYGQFVRKSDPDRVILWNRIEFEQGDGYARIVISSADPNGKSDTIKTRIPMMVILIGWIMAVIVECGGADVETNMRKHSDCPPECEDGYIRLEDGNYEPCPVCGGRQR